MASFLNQFEAAKVVSEGIIRREYGRWYRMMRRCYCPTDPAFKNYGGRGIVVDPRWHVFALFFADMGPCPGDGLSLDRIDNNAGYSKANVRWATDSEQAQNRRTDFARRTVARGSVLNVNGRWRALVRIKGIKPMCSTFGTEAEARGWADKVITQVA